MTTCPRCGLKVVGRTPHTTVEDCLRYLAPRYKLAQESLEAMHKRYRTMEERLDRAKAAARVARQEARRSATIPARLAALEAALALRKENDHAA